MWHISYLRLLTGSLLIGRFSSHSPRHSNHPTNPFCLGWFFFLIQFSYSLCSYSELIFSCFSKSTLRHLHSASSSSLLCIIFLLQYCRSSIFVRCLFYRGHAHLHFGKPVSSRLEADRKTHSPGHGDRWAHLQADCYTVELSLFSCLLLDALLQLGVESRPSPVNQISTRPPLKDGLLANTKCPFTWGKASCLAPCLSAIQKSGRFFILSFHRKTRVGVSGPSVIEVLGPTCLSEHFLSSAHSLDRCASSKCTRFYAILNNCKVYHHHPFSLLLYLLPVLKMNEATRLCRLDSISSPHPATELAWVWAQQKAWRAYRSKSAGHRHPDWLARKERDLVQLRLSSNTPPQSSGMRFVRFASQAPSKYNSQWIRNRLITELRWDFQQIGNNLSLIMTVSNIVRRTSTIRALLGDTLASMSSCENGFNGVFLEQKMWPK